VSPRAARLAADLGIDWTKIPGSGTDGRVRERDIAAAVAARGGQIPLVEETSDVRRTIAARMARSAHEAAPVTLTREIDASVLHGMIDRGIAFTAIWAKVVAHVLLDHPPLRSAWIDGDIEVSEPSDIAVAVDTDRGIFAPVLCDVHDKSVKELDVELRRLVERIRSGSMPPNPRHGAFTITNLGSYGVDAFTPILNLPQSAILGLGRMRETAVVASGKIEMRPMMWLSLTFDHRVLDGVPAARFLDDLSKLVENPKKLRALVGL
jgi:pyruvate dehydrogenase E2 component (dihydrolipoamide acetyltransferase)